MEYAVDDDNDGYDDDNDGGDEYNYVCMSMMIDIMTMMMVMVVMILMMIVTPRAMLTFLMSSMPTMESVSQLMYVRAIGKESFENLVS